MGEEKKEEEKKDEVKDEGKKKEEQKEKKVEEPPEIVLKVDMHCEACARKVARALKGFQGVEEVTTDSKARKVVVKGKAADPLKIYERLKKKTRRKVVLISPLPEPPEQNNQDPSPPPKEEKMEPPPVVTVVLSIRMHCEACAQALQKRVLKIRGVESVETNVATSQVIVKGIVDPTELISDVYKKTGKQAFIVKGEEKKKEEEKKEEVNKEEEKKEEEKKEEKKDDDEEEKAYTNRNEYWPSKSYLEYACCAPEMFSEDNPNACYVM
ncbi:heavy metal-associated isoprenylated plant protein 7 isoform X2 [Manihot esculenta]|uniref:heavy metal-associated isoprenylated plant protein 7 isoform X2 n=1 Tax=Manihot esculenta TaxID=3983 RepID=UPI000B5D37C9|nr:heavy metal-associated isoprenylated plant protein 7 isoform X2 [Manihot esculenta]